MSDSLEVLIVRRDGFLLAFPSEQLARIVTAPDTPEASPDSAAPDAGNAAGPSGEARGPVSVEVRMETGTRPVRVDDVEGMTCLDLSQIRTLPPLIQAQKRRPYLWGIALVDDRVVYLVDPAGLSPDAPGEFPDGPAEKHTQKTTWDADRNPEEELPKFMQWRGAS